MAEERYQCPECGKYFGSEDTLQEHSRLEHSTRVDIQDRMDIDFSRYLEALKGLMNRSFAAGMLVGILLAGAALSGYMYWDSLDHRTPVPVTVVTCDNCTYDRFQTATDRMFNAKYEEVDYQGEQGQQLIQKYDINYVPAFIFDDKVKEAEEFYKVESVLVEFDDAYVIPDRGNRVAQRLSEGRELEQ